jgi:predicted nucleotide-binding protein
MFWFAGKLGRKRVCALKKGDLEIPSDFAGVVYTEMDERGAWKQELLRELGAAGYKVDWQKALG